MATQANPEAAAKASAENNGLTEPALETALTPNEDGSATLTITPKKQSSRSGSKSAAAKSGTAKKATSKKAAPKKATAKKAAAKKSTSKKATSSGRKRMSFPTYKTPAAAERVMREHQAGYKQYQVERDKNRSDAGMEQHRLAYTTFKNAYTQLLALRKAAGLGRRPSGSKKVAAKKAAAKK